jgi:hypothetical protein
MFGRKFKAVRGIATLGVVAGVGLWAAVLPATAIVYGGPITITSGGVGGSSIGCLCSRTF